MISQIASKIFSYRCPAMDQPEPTPPAKSKTRHEYKEELSTYGFLIHAEVRIYVARLQGSLPCQAETGKKSILT
jgi:hypothetical protein